MNVIRRRWNVEIIPWRNMRRVFKVLREPVILGLVVDWGYRSDDIPVRLFGEWTTLPAGPAMLAAKTGAAIVPVVCRRLRRRHLPRPRTTIRSTSADHQPGRDCSARHRQIADAIEDMISAAPDQWYSFKPVWPDTKAEKDALAGARRGHGRRQHDRRQRATLDAVRGAPTQLAPRPADGTCPDHAWPRVLRRLPPRPLHHVADAIGGVLYRTQRERRRLVQRQPATRCAATSSSTTWPARARPPPRATASSWSGWSAAPSDTMCAATWRARRCPCTGHRSGWRGSCPTIRPRRTQAFPEGGDGGPMIIVGMHFGALEVPALWTTGLRGMPHHGADGDRRRPGHPGLFRTHAGRDGHQGRAARRRGQCTARGTWRRRGRGARRRPAGRWHGRARRAVRRTGAPADRSGALAIESGAPAWLVRDAPRRLFRVSSPPRADRAAAGHAPRAAAARSWPPRRAPSSAPSPTRRSSGGRSSSRSGRHARRSRIGGDWPSDD